MILSSLVRSDAGVVPHGLPARRAIGLACLLTSLAPVPVSAVGIGAVTQQSALGQSLRVVVPVTLGEGEAVSPECFRIAAAQQDADGIPQLLFGRVNVERSSAGTNLVITNPRPVNDPVVRLTIQAGCESAVRANTRCSWIRRLSRPRRCCEAAPREARRRAATGAGHSRIEAAGPAAARSSTRAASPAAQAMAPRPRAKARRQAAPFRKARRNARRPRLSANRGFRCLVARLAR
jgi:pilus assembly protein FimV